MRKLIILFAIAYAPVVNAQTNEGTNDSLPFSELQVIVVSANREQIKRSEAPLAISRISSKTIQEAKASSIDQLLNKVSGVNMVNLGNEQHQMSIRQPITTKSYFLYLEDGIPVRTTGLFNHNALLEMNLAMTKNIEVIKGPSSSIYGSEAIGGVVNFFTNTPSKVPELRLSAQANNLGYMRQDIQASFSLGKWGVSAGAYYATRNNNVLEYNNFHKSIFSIRADYAISDRTSLTNKITWLDYYGDMPGGIDSTMFAEKKFKNLHTFTFRQVKAWRYNSTLAHTWNSNSKTSVTLIFRDNEISQNPAYRIKDDYRKRPEGWSGRKDLAHGEINKSSFNSYAMIAQHRQSLQWKRAVIIGGISVDASPSIYLSEYIIINRDTSSGKYVNYLRKDSLLSKFTTGISNYAGYLNFEFSPFEKLRVVASLRYDRFTYNFNNHLPGSFFSGSADTTNYFDRVSSKIGATYNFNNKIGMYANYSEGFIPPQVTEMYNGVKVPTLEPAVARNYEVGGWIEILPRKLSAEISAYELKSTNEIISMRMDDGSTANANAGKTSHRGVELGITATPFQELSARFSGAYSIHRFETYVEKGERLNGKMMNGAPRLVYNSEVWYKPVFMKGLRIGAEVQHVGEYFADPGNTSSYGGYTILNLRVGYEHKAMEFWINALNVTDRYYATNVSKGSSGYNYTLAEPVSVNVGFAYNFGQLWK